MAMLMDGVTGILGASLSQELKNEVYFLVRNGNKNKRLPVNVNPENVFESDITKPFCGLSQKDINKLNTVGIDQFFHLAANVSFATKDTDGDIWNTNYTGTKNMLEIAKILNIKEFLHCSTVYAEDQRNPYEKSKLAAEKLVEKSGFNYSIFRISSIVGDSKTGYTSDFNGYYGVYSIFHRLAQKKRRGNDIQKVIIPIYIIRSTTSTLNLIPLDWVKHTIISLISKGCRNEIYNISHDNPPLVNWISEESFSTLSISGIKYWNSVADREKHYGENERPSFLQRQIDILMDRYIPYTTEERYFSHDSTIKVLGSEYVSPPKITKKLIETILGYAVEKNFRHK